MKVESTEHATRKTDGCLFLASGIAVLVVAFVGFSRSYYLRAWFSSRALPAILHLHGLIMTAWLVLFLTQAYLVAKHRIDLHRKLGLLGALLAAFVLGLGIPVIVRDIERQVPDVNTSAFISMFIAFDGLNLLVFAGLVLSALIFRQRSSSHKRLMLMGIVSLLPPALGRITASFVQEGGPFIVLAVMVSFVLAFVAVDTFRHRHMHQSNAWGGALVIVSSFLTYLAQTLA